MRMTFGGRAAAGGRAAVSSATALAANRQRLGRGLIALRAPRTSRTAAGPIESAERSGERLLERVWLHAASSAAHNLPGVTFLEMPELVDGTRCPMRGIVPRLSRAAKGERDGLGTRAGRSGGLGRPGQVKRSGRSGCCHCLCFGAGGRD